MSQNPNEKPSSEINLDDISQIGREIDLINAQEAAKKTSRKRGSGGPKLGDHKSGTATVEDTGEVKEAKVLPPDPEFIAMVTHGSSLGIDYMKEVFNLMEPGLTTREKIGFLCGRIAQRITFVEGGSLYGDLIIIAGYLAFWFVVGRQPKPQGQIPEKST